MCEQTCYMIHKRIIHMFFVHICTHVFCHHHVFTLFYDVCVIYTLLYTVACWVANMLHDTSKISMSIHKLSTTSTLHIDVLALWWLVAHLNGQVGWVSLHLLSFLLLLLLPCWWPLPFWTCFHCPLHLRGGRQQPCFTGGTGTAEGCCTTHHLSAQLCTSAVSCTSLQPPLHWLCRWTVTALTQVTGGLTTLSLSLWAVDMCKPLYEEDHTVCTNTWSDRWQTLTIWQSYDDE